MMSLRGRSERRPYAKNVTGHHFETGPDADSTGDSFVVSLLEMTRLANRTKKSARACNCVLRPCFSPGRPLPTIAHFAVKTILHLLHKGFQARLLVSFLESVIDQGEQRRAGPFL
jgi:hypothetical protein